MHANRVTNIYLCASIKKSYVDGIIKRQSAIIGMVGAIIAVTAYVAIWKFQWYSSGWMAVVVLIAPLLLGIVAQVLAKRALQGAISLKQCVLAFLIVVVLFFIAEALVNYLIFVVIDPSAQEEMREATLKAVSTNPNSAASSGVFKEPTFTPGEYFRAVLSKTLLYTVIGIISGFFIKNIKTSN
jgi:hypothetical protein